MQVDSEGLSLLAYILARWIITLHVLSGGVRFESVAVDRRTDKGYLIYTAFHYVTVCNDSLLGREFNSVRSFRCSK